MKSNEGAGSYVRAATSFGGDPSSVPILETGRLRLRAHRLEDAADCAAMWADPVVTRYILGKPSSAQQSWARLLGYIGHWSVLHFGYWAIEEKSTGAFVGEIGFADFKREIVPWVEDVPEFGFALASGAHGKGYATEAARAAIAWGDERLLATRTVCLIVPENVASLRVVYKCGYEVIERATCSERPTLFLARSRARA